ncbi:MAG: XRE family transcriptional regulator [Burkholderiaceae bacterium]|nr:XRE family transcriptional regulator [Burkholderiaceae bacterium]
MAKKPDPVPEEIVFERSSGNVFADLGLPEAEENKTKAVLAFRLNERIKAMGLKQADIAKRLRIAQPNVSALANYRLDNFSSEKLMEFFNLLGYDVDVYIRSTRAKRLGAMHVFMAV